jgi:hypothetical protein
MRRRCSHNAGEVVGSPGPCGKPALDVSTLMRNEGRTYSSQQGRNLIAPVLMSRTAAASSSQLKALTIEKGSTEQAYRCLPPLAPPGASQVSTSVPEPSRSFG